MSVWYLSLSLHLPVTHPEVPIQEVPRFTNITIYNFYLIITLKEFMQLYNKILSKKTEMANRFYFMAHCDGLFWVCFSNEWGENPMLN